MTEARVKLWIELNPLIHSWNALGLRLEARSIASRYSFSSCYSWDPIHTVARKSASRPIQAQFRAGHWTTRFEWKEIGSLSNLAGVDAKGRES